MRELFTSLASHLRGARKGSSVAAMSRGTSVSRAAEAASRVFPVELLSPCLDIYHTEDSHTHAYIISHVHHPPCVAVTRDRADQCVTTDATSTEFQPGDRQRRVTTEPKRRFRACHPILFMSRNSEQSTASRLLLPLRLLPKPKWRSERDGATMHDTGISLSA